MAVSTVSATRKGPRTRLPGPIAEELVAIADVFSRSQYQLVILAARFADSPEWVLAGASSAAAWLADIADVETCTARDWVRVGRHLRELPTINAAFEAGELSYSKVRALTRVAEPDNEAELAALATSVAAGDLGRALAVWMNRNSTPEELAAHQHRERSVKWRTEPDGMVTFTLRLPPQIAAVLISILTTLVMRTRPRREPDGSWPTVNQQHADALETVLTDGSGRVDTEVILHLRGDGATCDDGTPIPDSVIGRLVPEALIRTLIHDAEGKPVNASGRQRHPNARQKRIVKERDRVCVDCGRDELLEYDHNPAYQMSGRTLIDELELRCAPCHQQRHHTDAA